MGGKRNPKKIRSEEKDPTEGPEDMNIEEKNIISEESSTEPNEEYETDNTDSKLYSRIFEDASHKKRRNRDRRRKISKVNTLIPTYVKNAYECLTENDDIIEKDENTTTKLPPIVVKTGMSLKAFISEVNNYVNKGSDISFKVGRQQISIYTTKSEDYKTVIEKLKSKNFEFHTFSPKEDRAKRLVIKGLSCEFTSVEVEDELKKLGLETIKVNNMYKAKNTPSNMFLVSLPKTTQLNTILKTNKYKYICYQKVQWCKYIPQNNNAVQCYRCQRFGHSSSNCNYIHRCVKCTNLHEAGKCPKTEDDVVKCTNCDGEHPANYRQCPNYINYVSKLELNKTKANKPKTNIRPTTVFTTPNITYSNMTKNNNNFPTLTQTKNTKPLHNNNTPIIQANRNTTIIPNHTQEHTSTNNAFDFIDDINRLFNCTLEEFCTSVEVFMPRYRAAKSNVAKQIMIVSFVAQFK